MNLTVASVVDLAGVPSTKRGVRDWLKRLQIPLSEHGNRFTFRLSDLPEEVQRAYVEREIERAGLEPGEWDAEAQARFLDATPAMRSAALRRAEIARFMVARQEHMAAARLPGRCASGSVRSAPVR